MIKQVILTLALMGVSACATQPINMASGAINNISLNANSPLNQNVSVDEIKGGDKKQLFGAVYETQVTDGNLTEALKKSLAQNGMLSTGSGDYLVSAEVMKIKARGINNEVVSDIRYRLTETSSNELLMDEIITQAHTTKFSEALFSEKRLFLATQASVKANITEFIGRMHSMFESNTEKNNSGELIISFDLSLEERDYLP